MTGWFTMVPTTDGFYWVKRHGEITLAEVHGNGWDDGCQMVSLLLREWSSEAHDAEAHGITEWYGPIEPPGG